MKKILTLIVTLLFFCVNVYAESFTSALKKAYKNNSELNAERENINVSEEELKEGWPTGIERLIGKENPGKREISCPHCSNKLLVPNDYSGLISCPECGKQSTV